VVEPAAIAISTGATPKSGITCASSRRAPQTRRLAA